MLAKKNGNDILTLKYIKWVTKNGPTLWVVSKIEPILAHSRFLGDSFNGCRWIHGVSFPSVHWLLPHGEITIFHINPCIIHVIHVNPWKKNDVSCFTPFFAMFDVWIPFKSPCFIGKQPQPGHNGYTKSAKKTHTRLTFSSRPCHLALVTCKLPEVTFWWIDGDVKNHRFHKKWSMNGNSSTSTVS